MFLGYMCGGKKFLIKQTFIFFLWCFLQVCLKGDWKKTFFSLTRHHEFSSRSGRCSSWRVEAARSSSPQNQSPQCSCQCRAPNCWPCERESSQVVQTFGQLDQSHATWVAVGVRGVAWGQELSSCFAGAVFGFEWWTRLCFQASWRHMRRVEPDSSKSARSADLRCWVRVHHAEEAFAKGVGSSCLNEVRDFFNLHELTFDFCLLRQKVFFLFFFVIRVFDSIFPHNLSRQIFWYKF